MAGTSRARGLWVVGVVVAAGGMWVTVRALAGAHDDPGRRVVPVAVRPLPTSNDVDASDNSHGSGDDGSPATATASAGPFGEEWGVPVGYDRSEQGAQAAAVGWVAALGPLMSMGPIAVGDTLRELMTAAAAEPMVEAVRVERERFVRSFHADPVLAIWIDSPLRLDLVEFAGDRAVVKVWSQLLMGVTSDVVQVLWRTHTVTLRWERDDWRVEEVTRVEGPTPVLADTLLPSPGSEFTEPAGWTAAVVAGSSVETR